MPLVIAEAIPIAQPFGFQENTFIDYQYVEAHTELAEETSINNIKIIKID